MKKPILSPSILSADFRRLGEQIDETVRAGAEYIHFDVMDGLFVPNLTFGLPVLKCLKGHVEAVLDVHLMIAEPQRYTAEFIRQGADIVTFHYEAVSDVAGLCRSIRSLGAKAGVSIKPATPPEALFPYLDVIDLALVMSVEPGFGGQAFREEAYGKIRALRAEADRRGLPLLIEVDGGVGTGNAGALIEAGADVLVAGSAVFKEDITANTKALLKAMGALS